MKDPVRNQLRPRIADQAPASDEARADDPIIAFLDFVNQPLHLLDILQEVAVHHEHMVGGLVHRPEARLERSADPAGRTPMNRAHPSMTLHQEPDLGCGVIRADIIDHDHFLDVPIVA